MFAEEGASNESGSSMTAIYASFWPLYLPHFHLKNGCPRTGGIGPRYGVEGERSGKGL